MIIRHQHFTLQGKRVLERVVFKAPLKYDSSMHNEACFLYNRKGNMKLYGSVQSTSVRVREGVMLKCGNYLVQALQAMPEETTDLVAIHFFPEVLKEIYRQDLPSFLVQGGSSNYRNIESINISPIIEHFMEGLLLYFENPSLVTEQLIALKVKELITLLVQTTSEDAKRVKEILRGLFSPEEVTFKEVIEAHLFENLSLQELAILTNCSLSTFKRKFRTLYQMSPGKYIREKKLAKSAQLLMQTSLRVTDICFEVGFGEASQFTKAFHAHFGCSPTVYRSQALV
ncbi:MAG: helix-turn-helix domain-containing protein [Thermonemataceae bacterium]